jgi:hypothetical protein
MAVRSGAGTGVIVSLVVFVLTTVFLLVLTIVFYAGKQREMDQRFAAETGLNRYVTAQQRNTDAFKAMEKDAGRESVAMWLKNRNDQLMAYLTGDASLSPDAARQLFADSFGVDPNNGVVKNTLADLNRKISSLNSEKESLVATNKGLTEEIAEMEAKANDLKTAHKQEVELVRNTIASYGDSNTEYAQKLDEAINQLEQAKDRLRDQYTSRIDSLEDDIDRLNAERVTFIEKINEYQAMINLEQLRPTNPAMLVDGRIIDASGGNDQVFIDRGREHRIALGMTFEVYANENSIRANDRGELPRGKASLQVIRVGDTTSTCKVTRATPGQPIVRDDVLANAVYDPNYKFRFLIHGKFDVDGDGKPSESEAEFLRSRVIDWGGIVVTGDRIPGNLDFLVLGEEPQLPPPLPTNATEAQIADTARKRAAWDLYRDLFRQASEAQIPVLNANRFFILIGHTDR